MYLKNNDVILIGSLIYQYFMQIQRRVDLSHYILKLKIYLNTMNVLKV